MGATQGINRELMKLHCVNPNYVCQLWPEVSEMLESALEYAGGEYNIDQLKAMLSSGAKTLLIADDDGIIKGAAAISLDRWPNDHICYVMAIGGYLISSKEMFAQLCEWAKNQGCTKIQGAVRESVERLWRQRFNFSERYRIVEKQL